MELHKEEDVKGLPAQQLGYLRKLRDHKCRNKIELQEWLKTFLGVDLPDYTVDPESNCNPLEMVWLLYKNMVWYNELPEDERATKFLFYASRGGFKTLGAAIVFILALVHDKRGTAHIGAGENHVKHCYNDYFQPYIRSALIKELILTSIMEKTILKEDERVFVEIMPCTKQKTQGPHQSLVCVDGETKIHAEFKLSCPIDGREWQYIETTVIGLKDFLDNKIPIKVLSYNHDAEIQEFKKVKWIVESGIKRVGVLHTTEKTKLICTPDHKVYDNFNEKYVEVQSLEDSSCGLELAGVRFNKAVDLSFELLDEKRRVYDLCVEDNENFYANNILVHNCKDEIDVVQDLSAYNDIDGIPVNMSDGRPPLTFGISVRKCLTENCYVYNGRSVKKINEVCGGENVVYDKREKRKVLNVFPEMDQECVRIETTKGTKIESSLGHKHLILNKNADFELVEARDLSCGDLLISPRKMGVPFSYDIDLDPIDLTKEEFNYFYPPQYRHKPSKHLPAKLTSDLCYMMGLLIGDGTLGSRDGKYSHRIIFSNTVDGLCDRYRKIFKDNFNLELKGGISGSQRAIPLVNVSVKNAYISKFMRERLGLKFVMGEEKEIPKIIYDYFCEEFFFSFLAGLFDSDGNCHVRRENGSGNFDAKISFFSTSKKLIDGIKLLLDYFDIKSNISSALNNESNNIRFFIIKIYSNSAFKLGHKIYPYITKDIDGVRWNNLNKLLCCNYNKNYKKVDIYGLQEYLKIICDDYKSKIKPHMGLGSCPTFFIRDESKSVSLNRVRKFLGIAHKRCQNKNAKKLLDIINRYDLQSIKSIENIGIQKTYNIEVDKDHIYSVNNLLTSNSMFGLMQKEIEEAPKKRVKVFHWNLIDVAQRCPDERSGIEPVVNYIRRNSLEAISSADYEVLPFNIQQEYDPCQGFKGCIENCTIFAACQGNLKNQKSQSTWLKTIEYVDQKLFESADEQMAIAQFLCRKPPATGLIFPTYNPELSELKSQSEMWEIFTRDKPDHEIEHEELIAKFQHHGIYCYFGLDWGFEPDPTVVLAVFIDKMNNIFVVDEFEALRTSEAEVCHWLAFSDPETNWKSFYRPQLVFPDTAQPGGRKELEKVGFTCVGPKRLKPKMQQTGQIENLIKDVKPGITVMRRFIRPPGTRGTKLYILKERCPRLCFELARYHNEVNPDGTVKSDQPAKNQPDHACFIAGTKIDTSAGKINIEDLKVGQKVLTRQGYCEISDWAVTDERADVWEYEFSNGSKIICTDNHPIWVENRGFVAAGELTECDIVCTNKAWKKKLLFSMELNLGDILNQKIYQTKGTISPHLHILNREFDTYTKKFGRAKMVKFLKDIIFIIRMGIVQIIELRIWKQLELQVIYLNTQRSIVGRIKRRLKNIWKELDQWPQSGIDQKRGVNGIRSRGKRLGKIGEVFQRFAKSVRVSFGPEICPASPSFAQTNARQNTEEKWDWTMRQGSVNCAENHFNATGSLKQDFVEDPAVHLIKAKYVGKRKVYNITVNKAHEYFANGILVSNCDALRYLLASLFYKGEVHLMLDANFSIAKYTNAPTPVQAGAMMGMPVKDDSYLYDKDGNLKDEEDIEGGDFSFTF